MLPELMFQQNEVDFIHEMLKVEVADESVKEGLAKGQ